MPRLENWAIINDNFRDCSRLVGDIYDDDRFPDGKAVSTSRLVEVDFANNVALTKNTKYVLGKRRSSYDRLTEL
jgi:hypothetical protein